MKCLNIKEYTTLWNTFADSNFSHKEARIDILFFHWIVAVLSFSPGFKSKLVHKVSVFVYLGWLATDLLICMLQEKEVWWEVNISMASWNQVSVFVRSAFNFLRNKGCILPNYTLSRHDKGIKVGHYKTMIRYDSFDVFKELKSDCWCENIVQNCLFLLRSSHVSE